MIKIADFAKICGIMLFATFAPLTTFADKIDASGAKWKYHTSFDNQPRKVIDTPNATFFFVHQHMFNLNQGLFGNPSGGLFMFDKSNPEAGIVDLQHRANLSGAKMHLAEYNPAGDYLLIVYTDGEIDILKSDMSVQNIKTIKGHHFPGIATVNSVTFEAGKRDAWIATKGGFFHIDDNLRPAEIGMWNKNVTSFCRIGQNYVASINGAMHTAPVTKSAINFSAYTSVAGVSSASGFMPLSENCLAYIAAGGDIRYITFNGTTPSASASLAKDNAIYQTNGATIAISNIDHTISPTEGGYMVNALNAAYQISAPEGEAAPAVKKIAHSQNPSLYCGSWDFKNFWFYADRAGFIQRQATSDTAWGTSSAPLRPSAPLACFTANFGYSPNHGLVSTNGYMNWLNWNAVRHEPALISIYRNGKWENAAPCYSTPYITDNNSSLLNTYNAQARNRFPVSDPDGFCVDPLFPDWVHVGSLRDGFASINISDPRANPIMHTDSQNPLSNFSAVKDLPNQGNDTYTGTYMLGADGNDNIWMMRSNFHASSGQNDLYLWCWTPEARREALESGDHTKADNWIKLQYPLGAPWSWTWGFGYKVGVACKHPSNANKLVLYFNSDMPIIVYDHKGTLNDTSDDEVKLIKYFISETSAHRRNTYFTYEMKEDPVTGKILIFDAQMCVAIDINRALDSEGCIVADYLESDQPSTEDRSTLDTFGGSRFSFDEYGRFWYAQGTNGVTCLSADRSKVLFRWTIGDSPLPSEFVYSCGWNPDTKSVFLSTDCGLVEVTPDIKDNVPMSNTEIPFATPSIITSDYAGTVALYNVPKGTGLYVKNAQGKRVSSVDTDLNGIGHWNLLDDNGNRVPAGRYIISDPALNISDIEILIAR